MLKVWLPLTGTLENQGCSEIAVTNHNATVDNSGKIGKCYLLNGTNAYINGTYNATQEISFCCWANFPSIKSAHLFDARTSGGTGYQPMYVTASSIQIGASGSNYTNFSQSFSNNTWYHICVTHSATEGKCYINGNLIGTSTSAKGANMGTCAFTLGSRCNQSNYQNAKINDVRIYDHCLSAAEVKEISQGLVLHYKLDSFQGGYGNPNLLPASDTTFFNTTRSFEFEEWVKNFYTTTWVNEHLTVGQQYTLSYTVTCLSIPDTSIYSVSETRDSPILVHQGGGWSQVTTTNDGIKSTNLLPGQSRTYKCTFTFATATESQAYYGFCGYTCLYRNADRTSNAYARFRIDNLKLELGSDATPWIPNINDESVDVTHIQDSSGYGHNGTINGTLTLSNDTPRYSTCAVFNGTNTRIKVPNLTPDAITVSFWMKRNANTGTRQFLYTSWSGVTCELTTSGTTTFAVNKSSYPTISGSAITTSTGWIHYCGTFDIINGLRLYENGVLKSSNTSNLNAISWSISTNYIGYYNTYYNGLMSDFRIYCTALSADDIKQLYNTAAKIDNLHNMHTFEYIEDSSNIKLTKQGQFKEGEIQEDITTKFYKTNNTIKAKNFIEF